ncbi:MAG: DUF1080 domain-containing protein [Hyphomonadaceae bacterium]|nr:DUF1080 domain-containing protein [Hyphomonadaceae bacterium]
MISKLKACAVVLLASACASTGGAADLLASGLDGFTVVNTANWSYAGGVVQASTGGAQPSVLVTKEDYQDFELTLEVYVSEEHNSGVFIRCSDRTNIQATNCYEINIFDKRPDQTFRTGGAPGFFKPLAQVDAAGKWNTLKIRAEGPHILAVFNGVTTIDSDGPLLSNGPIALQWGAGEVKFRSVRVKRLP